MNWWNKRLDQALEQDYRQHLICYVEPEAIYDPGMWFDLCFHPYPLRWDDLPPFVLVRARDKGLLDGVLMHDLIESMYTA